jgi:hypothetical protein
LQEAFQFAEHGGKALIDFGRSLGIAHQSLQGFTVLASEVGNNLGGDVSVTGFGVMRGIDQAIGNAAHCRNDDNYGGFGGGRLDDVGGSGDAGRVAHRGASELHDAQRRHYRALAAKIGENAFRPTEKTSKSGPLMVIVLFRIPWLDIQRSRSPDLKKRRRGSRGRRFYN